MNAIPATQTDEIHSLVRELAAVMARQRRSLAYVAEFIAANIPADARAGGGFHLALADAAGTANPELENWALAQAAALRRDSGSLSRLRDSHAAMGNLDAAALTDADLAAALVREGRADEALPVLARWLALPPDAASASAAVDRRALAAACLSRASVDPSAAASVRSSLRARLWTLLEGNAPSGDFNLLAIAFDGPGYRGPDGVAKAIRAFQELLEEPRAEVREPLAPTAELRVLWHGPAGAFWLAAGQARRIEADPAILETARACAHFILPSGTESAPALPAPGAETRASLAAREGFAIRNLGLLGGILGTAMGLEGYAQPDVARLMGSLAEAGSRYAATGLNTEEAYGRFVHFFCVTSGLSNAFMSFLIRLYNPPYPDGGCNGLLGRFTHGDQDRVARDLKRDGVHVFPQRLPDALVDELVRYAETGPCYRHAETEKGLEPERYPRDNPAGATYDFMETDLIQVPAIQRLMADPCLYGISQAYFGAKPGLDAVQMWWSAVFTRKASSEAAQLYHFDLERVQWLKWFVYLTDVDTDSGPHCFIRGSHLAGRKPSALLQRGYQRISDEDMALHFPKEDFLEITGPKGTVFVEDTSGFHKGKVPTRAHRLALEIEFSNTLFGTAFPRNARIREGAYPPLLEAARLRPQLLGKYGLP